MNFWQKPVTCHVPSNSLRYCYLVVTLILIQLQNQESAASTRQRVKALALKQELHSLLQSSRAGVRPVECGLVFHTTEPIAELVQPSPQWSTVEIIGNRVIITERCERDKQIRANPSHFSIEVKSDNTKIAVRILETPQQTLVILPSGSTNKDITFVVKMNNIHIKGSPLTQGLYTMKLSAMVFHAKQNLSAAATNVSTKFINEIYRVSTTPSFLSIKLFLQRQFRYNSFIQTLEGLLFTLTYFL